MFELIGGIIIWGAIGYGISKLVSKPTENKQQSYIHNDDDDFEAERRAEMAHDSFDNQWK